MAIPSGEIYLLKGVPLNTSYEHTIDFKNKDEQFEYFYSFVKHVITKYTYIRREREYLSVELPLTDLDDVNYILFRSADGERLYYAFVTDKTFTNPSTSAVFYQIDVMQTFQFDYKWKASYIKQAHVDRWTAEHKPIYSKTDEGLDYGTEYSIESAYRLEQSANIRWLLVSMKDFSAIKTGGYNFDNTKFDPVPSSFITLMVPIAMNKDNDTAPTVFTIDNFDNATIHDVGSNVFCGYEYIVRLMLNSAFGDYVQSISLLTYNPFVESAGDFLSTTFSAKLTNAAQYAAVTFADPKVSTVGLQFLAVYAADKSIFNNVLARAEWTIGLENTLPTAAQWSEIKSKPYTTPRDKRFESKLLCAPYRYNLLTDWRNSPVIFKNEYMTTDEIVVNYSLALSHNAPMRFWIKDYKRDPEGRYTSLSQPMAPEFPIINDAYSQYMLQNKNTIQTNLTNAMINAGAGVISGAISGGGMGGAPGAVFGALSGAAGGVLNVTAQIRSENAKQADLKAVPDGVINTADSAFNIVDRNDVVTFYRMSICCENEQIIAEIFNMSGYKVNRVEIPNTRSRTRFNYIQTVGANITGAISQRFIEELKAIFNAGVTIWHYNKEHFNMLDYSYENIEVNLL